MDPEDQSSTRAVFMESASAVQVAHIANLLNILPTAYYQLSRLDNLDLWWQDLVFQPSASEDCRWKKNGTKRHPVQTLLSKEDLRRIKTGKENLSRHLISFKKGLSTELVLHPSCAVAWNMGIPVQSDDVLADLMELCNAKVTDVCSECRLQMNERGREERERVWESLPLFFGVLVSVEASA
ncbi:hypothetical protein JVU11DRAFT_8641 [Chiua virens]|nr:hypothetical protein JVU11DRAFT_8641 [Chiua virens]